MSTRVLRLLVVAPIEVRNALVGDDALTYAFAEHLDALLQANPHPAFRALAIDTVIFGEEER